MTSRSIVAGFDIGGAHLKATRVENGEIADTIILPTPVWEKSKAIADSFRQLAQVHHGAKIFAFTMTAELSDVFPDRPTGVRKVLEIIGEAFPSEETRIYSLRGGFIRPEEAAAMVGDALLADMGSTTTDLIPVRNGAVAARGVTDAERLAHGELVYAGFVRSYPFAHAQQVPFNGRLVPIMNEYFSAMSDVYRVLGVLDEDDDLHRTADHAEKTRPASAARLARQIGVDPDILPEDAARNVARWFAERQLRAVHDAAFLVGERLPDDAPVVGAGIGLWLLRRLAHRMDRTFIDLADLLPAADSVRKRACDAAPATAVALLAAMRE